MITANELRKMQPIQERYKDALVCMEQQLLEANKKGYTCFGNGKEYRYIEFEFKHKPKNDVIELCGYLTSLGYGVELNQPSPPFRGYDYLYIFEIRW